jgi:ribonuclease HII
MFEKINNDIGAVTPVRIDLIWPQGALTLVENHDSGNLHSMKTTSKIDSPLLFHATENRANGSVPDFAIENHFFGQGLKVVAGVDEVGRGPLAGPVVAACVILDPSNFPAGLNDSKKLTPTKREILFVEIVETAIVSVSCIPGKIIDQINIRQASLLAMHNSCHGLSLMPEILLVDGKDCPADLDCHSQSFIKGDSRSLSIAAASIVAKVIRDKQMVYASTIYPEYGFDKHKGYGTRAHLDAIEEIGPCPLHRYSFSPMKQPV